MPKPAIVAETNLQAAQAALSGVVPDLGCYRFQDIAREFAKRVYKSAWETKYRGIPCIKQPADLWVYQEIIDETQPTVIIETGTHCGGSAYFMADILRLRGAGMVFTIDIAPKTHWEHPFMRQLTGNCLSVDLPLLTSKDRVMVVLDCDHTREHVTAELKRFAPLVTPGCYLIVEDTNQSGNPIFDGDVDPYGAVLDFLRTNSQFETDYTREKYGITQSPGGYLRRIAA